MTTKTASVQSPKLSAFLLISGILVAVAAPFLFALPAQTQETLQCEYEGKKYNPGETVGPLLCLPDGTWQVNG